MKAVMCDVPEFIVEWRRTTGADRYDEMWDGVLHMGPSPNYDHQVLEFALERWLWTHWIPVHRGQVAHQMNVTSIGGWPGDYRIPDLVLLTRDRIPINRNQYFEGAPSAVVEIHSPGDEAYEKLPFYAALGVPEVWIIHRDTKHIELYELTTGEYRLQPAMDGWLRSSLGIQFQAAPPGKLRIQLHGDAGSQRTLPDD